MLVFVGVDVVDGLVCLQRLVDSLESVVDEQVVVVEKCEELPRRRVEADEAVRRRILVQNPARLYDFAEV